MHDRDSLPQDDNEVDAIVTRAIKDKTDNDADKERGVSPSNAVDPDWHLQSMVRVCNQLEKVEFPMTIMLNGISISGYLVSVKKYFEQWAADMANGIPGLSQTEKERYRQKYTDTSRLLVEQAAANDNPPYLHLHKIRILGKSNDVPFPEEKIFRFRVGSVDAWTLGQLRLQP